MNIARGDRLGQIDRGRAEAHLTFVFVGAGYAGVEALAELADLVRDALRYYSELPRHRTRWVLVDAAPKILPEIPSRLGDYAARQLARRGIEIRTSTTLESVGPGTVVLSGGERIPSHTLVWTAGVRPSPLLAELGLPLDERGRVKVDSALRIRPFPIPRRPSTLCARPAGSRGISAGSRSRTATGHSGRSRRSGGTRGSRSSSASLCVASWAGS